MEISLPLNEMTLSEKLQVMEALWEDLSRDPESLDSPAWHQTILTERDQKIREGKAEFTDWEQVYFPILNR